MLALLALAPVWIAAVQQSQPLSARPTPADLGASRCLDCHAATVAAYAETGMARALGPLVPGELAGLGEVAAGETGYRYHFEGGAPKADGGLSTAWIVETFEARGEHPELRRSVPLAFAVGAGELDRSYVARENGRLWFAPLEVLSAADDLPRRAALAPGHGVQPDLRFDSPIAEECLACHTDQLPPRSYPLNLAPEGDHWTPRGISCAACHGDVEGHADWREAELAGGRPAGGDPLLDLTGLGPERRLSVCARCHLQGDARIALTPGERGVPAPGGDFLEQWAVYLPRVPDGQVAFVSQVERLVASPCYLGSREAGADALTCTTCHDPHRSTADPRERRRVRDACLGCHASQAGTDERSGCSLPMEQRAARDCVDCHMPRTPVFDVDQVRIHDHLIAREPALAALPEGVRIKHTTDGDLQRFSWPGTAPAASDPGLELMAAVIAGFPERGAALVDREPAPAVLALATYNHLRGMLLERLGRDSDAAAAYGAALSRDREQLESAVNLTLVLGRLGRAEDGIELATRVLERHPRSEGALRNRALLHLSRGDQAAFTADLAAAQALLPRAAVARALADVARREGDEALARERLDEARRLAPHQP